MAYSEFEFPPIIKGAVHGLDNKWRWKIVESIMNKGDMSYSMLMSELKLDNKGLLNFHLKNLSKSALVERYEDLSSSDGDRSFYTISEIGKEIVNGLLAGLNPSKKILYYVSGSLQTSAISREKNTYDPFYESESIIGVGPELEEPVPIASSAT